MNAVAKFRKSSEYVKFSPSKKEIVERKIREAALKKEPRVLSESNLSDEDILKIKGLVADLK
jgi:hypothetical protein